MDDKNKLPNPDFSQDKTQSYHDAEIPRVKEPDRVEEPDGERSAGGFDPFDQTISTIRTSGSADLARIQIGRNTNIFAETTSVSTLSCGNTVDDLLNKYNILTDSQNIFNQEHILLKKRIGKGNQGVVFFSERLGTDHFHLPIALKLFSPDGFRTDSEYAYVMNYNAKVASSVAKIQHDNLLAVRNWFLLNDIRIMEMEWIDGYDLFQLMHPSTLDWMATHLTPEDYQYKTQVVITPGPVRPRLRPGIALTIIRDCLLALSALHNIGIVHADIKPANIMLKRTGCAKIIDLGAAFFYQEKPPMKLCTPFYAAPEIISEKRVIPPTPQSDIASLGYVLIELLAGRSPFEHVCEENGQRFISASELVRQKWRLVDRLRNVLPEDVQRSDMLVDFCARMIHPNREIRFQCAQDAIVAPGGIGDIFRSLVQYNLASEYDVDIQSWISSLDL